MSFLKSTVFFYDQDFLIKIKFDGRNAMVLYQILTLNYKGRDDTAAGISSIKLFFNQEVLFTRNVVLTKYYDFVISKHYR